MDNYRFRGVSLADGYAVFGYYVHLHDEDFIVDDDGNFIAVDPKTVCQFVCTAQVEAGEVDLYETDGLLSIRGNVKILRKAHIGRHLKVVDSTLEVDDDEECSD